MIVTTFSNNLTQFETEDFVAVVEVRLDFIASATGRHWLVRERHRGGHPVRFGSPPVDFTLLRGR
jgi:hypothetical protein